MTPTILVADDEEDVLNLVATNLKAAGFDLLKAYDGVTALEKARANRPALIILDLMLPGMTGLEVCRALKEDSRMAEIPVIMLTAKAAETDRIAGLELGADDYITKPFSPRELVLRVKSVLRRAAGAASEAKDVIAVGPLEIDRSRHQVRVNQKEVELTATEYKLILLLLERRGRVQSRDTLLNEVWGYESLIDTRTVDTHVRRLREKLGVAADCIETVRGFGYRVADES